ncbi:MAG: Glyoxalase/bleomycin resistance protein/dioxygenase [Candidatus Saccharibacteria bacterium]|jgi:catechol 2,3-dioxygenase-like lactoylglutathione lyase family enzyme|nr:Glyoxalase/bleomycin resistance protein/dioxygenase [Candidatus Saccharibacteria bacterium]
MLGDSTIYTTIAVSDMQLSKEFYGKKLGLNQVDESPIGIKYESGSGKLLTYQSTTAGTSEATCAAWQVDDVEAVVSDLQLAGVVFDNYDIPGADVDGHIYTIGSQKAAWFHDPDGNILSISS